MLLGIKMYTNYYLDTHLNKKNEATIFIDISIAKNRFKLSTRSRVQPKYWDEKKQRIKASFIGSPEFNARLTKLNSDVLKIYNRQKSEDEPLDLLGFKKSIRNIVSDEPKSTDSQEFWSAYNDYLDYIKSNKAEGTFKKYQTMFKHIEYWDKERQPVTFELFDIKFYDKFVLYLNQKKRINNNTVGKYIKNLKAFLSWAYDREYHSNEKWRDWKAPSQETVNVSLTEKELMTLYHMDLSYDPSLAKIRDVFCFGCFTGQRYSDIYNFKWQDIEGDFWINKVQKTKDHLEVPLNVYAKSIITRYKEAQFKGERVLPVLTNQRLNTRIKDLCEDAGLDGPIRTINYIGNEVEEEVLPKWMKIGTHTGRRTFITLSLEKGMRVETVMSITGHSDYRTFQKYIKHKKEVKRREMDEVWG